MRLKLCAAFALLAMGAPAAKADESVAIRNGAQTIFAVTDAGGSELKLAPMPGGAGALPKPGEISLSLSTTQAVGAPKLHIYNQYAKAIVLTFAAMRGGTVLASDRLCGHLDTDSWTVLPSKTSRVVVSHAVALEGDCP